MPRHPLTVCCDDVLTLLAQIGAAVDRRDLNDVFRLDEEVTHLMTKIEFLLSSALEDPSSLQMATSLGEGIRRAVQQVEQNRTRVARWMEETRTDLAELYRAADATRKYAAQGPAGPLLTEQKI